MLGQRLLARRRGDVLLAVAVHRHSDRHLPAEQPGLHHVLTRLALLAALSSCKEPAKKQPPPDVELAGCAEFRRGPICEVAAGAELTLWIKTVGEHFRISLDGRSIEPQAPTAVQGGLRMRIPASPGALAVTVSDSEPWQITLAAHAIDADLAEVAKLRRAGDLEAAEKILANLGPDRRGASGQRARNALAAGRISDAIASFEHAVRQDVELGLIGSEVRDRTALAHTLFNHGHRFEEAARTLEVNDSISSYAEGAADLTYSKAVLAAVLQDVRQVLAHTRDALDAAERLALEENQLDMQQLELQTYAFIGRWLEAKETMVEIRRAIPRLTDVCKRAGILTNLGWYSLLGTQRAKELFPEMPRDELQSASELFRTSCQRPARLANAELNLAWLELLSGRFVEASARLQDAREAYPNSDSNTRLNMLHVEAELLLARSDLVGGISRFRELETIARKLGHRNLQWHALFGQGEAFRKLGRNDDAVRAFAAAEHVLDEIAWTIPIGQGRESLLFDRSLSGEHLVELLLRSSRLDEAAEAMHRGQIRALVSRTPWTELAQRRDRAAWEDRIRTYHEAQAVLDELAANEWRRPTNQKEDEHRRRSAEQRVKEMADTALLARSVAHTLVLRKPIDDEGAVLVHPTASGIAIILTDRKSQRSSMFSTRTPHSWDDAMPSISSWLSTRSRVRLHVHPSLDRVDWHVLPLDVRPLLEHVPVTYAAALNNAKVSTSSRAIVIGDPLEALPEARLEAEQIAAALRRSSYEVELLVGEDVRLPELIGMIEAGPLDLIHYSGHGAQKGWDGLNAGFDLQNGQRFDAASVLMLRRVPRTVVLSACELAQQGSLSGSSGLGIARAFLLAGTRVVIAAPRDVKAAESRVLFERFYERQRGGLDPIEALRQAQLEQRRMDPMSDWGAFRVLIAE